MPRIDLDKIKNSFKKKEYRAWDDNLLETLKISKIDRKDPNSTSPYKSSNLHLNAEETSSCLDSNKGSNGVQQEFLNNSFKVHSELNNGSDSVQSQLNQGSIKAQMDINIKVQSQSNNDVIHIEKLLRNLGGNEKKLFFYFIDICITKSSLSTGDIPGKNLIDIADTTKNGMETAIKRLNKKGLIFREKGKTGRYGVINISISDDIKNEAIKYLHTRQLDEEILLNCSSIRVHSNHSNKVQLGFSSNTNSSSYINKLTTDLPEDWKKINYEELVHIGFSETQLQQLYMGNFSTPEIIQESINHFSYGFQHNEKVKAYTDPLNVLMGVLRKGQKWHEINYISPQELAFKQLLNEKKERKEKQQSMLKELVELEFPEWRQNLDEEDIKKIVPKNIIKIKAGLESALRTYFVEKILSPELIKKGLI